MTDDRSQAAMVLKNAREWLSDPAHWCQDKLFRYDASGAITATCLLGAINRQVFASGSDGIRAARVIAHAASWDLYDMTAVRVNDVLGYEATMRVLELAISRS